MSIAISLLRVQRNLMKITNALATPREDEAIVTEGILALKLAAKVLEERYHVTVSDEMVEKIAQQSVTIGMGR